MSPTDRPDPLTVEGRETARYLRPVVDRGAIAWTTAAFLVLIGVVLLVLAQLSAPRSASEGSTAPAVLPVGSQGQSGAPSTPIEAATGTEDAGESRPQAEGQSPVQSGHHAATGGLHVLTVTPHLGAPALLDTAAIGTAEQALSGKATWYDAPSRFDAAAGPLLREALGKHWRGRWVTVTANGHSILARLSDWCLCSKDRRLVDLDRRSFAILAPLSQGVVDVTVSWEDGPVPTLPPTDTEEAP